MKSSVKEQCFHQIWHRHLTSLRVTTSWINVLILLQVIVSCTKTIHIYTHTNTKIHKHTDGELRNLLQKCYNGNVQEKCYTSYSFTNFSWCCLAFCMFPIISSNFFWINFWSLVSLSKTPWHATSSSYK